MGHLRASGVNSILFNSFLTLLIQFFQAPTLVTPEELACVPGFGTDRLILKMIRNDLPQRTLLGRGKDYPEGCPLIMKLSILLKNQYVVVFKREKKNP